MESNAGSTKIKNARPKVLVTPRNRANQHLTAPFSLNGREVQAVLKLRTPLYATSGGHAATEDGPSVPKPTAAAVAP